MKFDLENRKDRIIRLTANSSSLGDAVLAPKGDKLYYCAAFEKGFDLWEHDLKEKSTKLLLKNVGRGTLFADKKVENLYLTAGGKLKKIELKDSKENRSLSRPSSLIVRQRSVLISSITLGVKSWISSMIRHSGAWIGKGMRPLTPVSFRISTTILISKRCFPSYWAS